ncbi:hypothetical protein BD770DRAFT_459581 [Pilaira anomala]|nr:hypothetical protein BD770DRAFT_459581 [Pilaira anomala]
MASARKSTATSLPYLEEYLRETAPRPNSCHVYKSSTTSAQIASSSSTSMQGLSGSTSSDLISSQKAEQTQNKKPSLCQIANKFFKKIMSFKIKPSKKARNQKSKKPKKNRYDKLSQFFENSGKEAYAEATADYNSDGVALHTASVFQRYGISTDTETTTQGATKPVTKNRIIIRTTTATSQPEKTNATKGIVFKPKTATTTSQIATNTIIQPETTAALARPEATAITQPTTAGNNQPETSIVTSLKPAVSNESLTSTESQLEVYLTKRQAASIISLKSPKKLRFLKLLDDSPTDDFKGDSAATSLVDDAVATPHVYQKVL